MQVHYATPSQSLAPFVKRYWAIENTLEHGEQCVERMIPTGLTELLLYFTPRPTIVNGPKSLSANVALYGHQPDYYDIALSGDLSVFSIVFQPQGLMRFFNFPLHEICNQNVPLRFIDKAGQELEEKMGEATTFHQRVRIAETYLWRLLNNDRADFEFRRINRMIDLIKQTHGTISIHQMSSEACLSRKQFERVFAEHVGISPKQYLKIIRFQYVLFQKQQNLDLNMSKLSYDSGYFDQSHFINDFKSFSGMTPKQYFNEQPACSDFFE